MTCKRFVYIPVFLLLVLGMAPRSFAVAAPAAPDSATLLAAGDNLVHDTLFKQSAMGGGYDFSPVYAPVAPLIQSADIALLNLEGPVLAGEPSGYPRFCAPPALAAALFGAGFDLLSLSNNHILDRGIAGARETASTVSAAGLLPVGLTEKPGGAAPVIIKKNNITFSFLAFTALINAPYSITQQNLPITPIQDSRAVAAQMHRAREQSDVVVVSVHFGEEDSGAVSPAQRRAASTLAELGADVIFGHHPHVIQPFETLSLDDGRKTLVFYSLGNFVSAQHRRENLVGLLPKITVQKDQETGALTLMKPDIEFVITHYEEKQTNLSLYPLSGYPSALARRHGVREFGPAFDVLWLERYAKGFLTAQGQKIFTG